MTFPSKKIANILAMLWLLNACTLPETPRSQPTTSATQASKAIAEKGDRYTARVIKVADGDTLTVCGVVIGIAPPTCVG